MEWSETGIVLATRPHGETSAILTLFTRGHGRHLGMVRGGRSRRLRPVLQIGNSVNATWRARLHEHLGHFQVEPETFRAAKTIDDPARLAALTSLCALANLLPERHGYERLYDASLLVFDGLEDDALWPALMVRWELGLLEALGFGLDLSECAANGSRDNLAYVSPRSGRAVSAEGGAPYAKKLLALPDFLLAGADGVQKTRSAGADDIAAGFALTGYFLNAHIWGPRGLKPPASREVMISRLARSLNPGAVAG